MADRLNQTNQAPQAAPFLEGALLFTIIAHGLAMLSMFLLLPALPGGLAAHISQRAAYVAHHPWLWRIGWFPWQMTALSDLLLAIALLITPWLPKLPAIIALIATLAAIIPDQTGQFLWTWAGPHVAAAADDANYLKFEDHVFHLIAGWGTMGYLAGALAWTWSFAAANVWSRQLTRLSVATWSLFAISTALLMLNPSPVMLIVVSLGNAAAFVLLMIWLIEVAEKVLHRSRPDTSYGRYAPWRHPSRGFLARAADLIANSRVARAMGELLPALAMDSDITDVVYANYIVEADHLDAFVTHPLKLQRLGPEGRYAMFTFLSFRHGHFGPRCLGPLRRLWPSPIQSNWRIHVYDPMTEKRGIQFLTIAVVGTPYALAARLLAENVPMHVPAAACMSRSPQGVITLQILPGTGTAPDVEATFLPSPEPALTHPWNECFETWHAMLSYCVPQDRAMSAQPWRHRITRQEIALNIPLENCRPMQASIVSRAATVIAGQTLPLCFVVDKLAFRLLKEQRDTYPGGR